MAAFVGSSAASGQNDRDLNKLLVEQAERLAWLKAWPRATPLYAEAERLFAARGVRLSVLYAQINGLRGRLPRLAVPEVSEQLAEHLENPLIQADRDWTPADEFCRRQGFFRRRRGLMSTTSRPLAFATANWRSSAETNFVQDATCAAAT